MSASKLITVAEAAIMLKVTEQYAWELVNILPIDADDTVDLHGRRCAAILHGISRAAVEKYAALLEANRAWNAKCAAERADDPAKVLK
jgi:hypothetical protein